MEENASLVLREKNPLQKYKEDGMDLLVQKRHAAEKNEENYFAYFNDLEMIAYFIYQQKNLNTAKDSNERTKKEYERELIRFAKLLVEYQDEIGLDIHEVVEGSLFKSLAPRHIENYQTWFYEKYPYIIGRNSNYSPATIARKNSIIKSFLRFLYENEYIQNDLTRFLKTATVQSDERPDKDLDPSQVIQLLDYFSEKEPQPVIFGLIHVLVATGLRNGELCRITIGDIFYDGERKRHYVRVIGKGNKRRTIPLNAKVYESINRLRAARGLPSIEESHPGDPLITTSTGKAYSESYLSQYLHKVMKQTPLPFVQKLSNPITPHTFRHAFAIISYHEKVDVYTIQRSLGHDRLETTMIYLQKEFESDHHASLRWDKGDIAKYM